MTDPGVPDEGLPSSPLPDPYSQSALGHPRVVAAVEVLLCSGVPTQLLLRNLLDALGWGPTETNLRPLLVVLGADTALLIALMTLLMRARGERPGAVWLGTRPLRTEIVLGIWLVPVVFVTVVAMLNALRLWLPWLHNVTTNPLETLVGTGSDAVLFGAIAIIAGGVREELQRAFLLRRFEQHLGGTTTGVIVLSAAFGAGHVAQGWDAGVTTALLGALWAIVYVRRRSVVAPMVSHAGFNALEVITIAVLAA